MNQQITLLQGNLGVLVHALVEGLNRQLSPSKLDAVEYTVLNVCLGAGTISISDLKKLLPIDPGRMTRTTNNLEDKGLIEKTRPRDNRRVVVLRVTEDGVALAGELNRRVQEFYGLLVRGISLEELAESIEVMERMIATGTEAEGDPAPPAHSSDHSSNGNGDRSRMADQPEEQAIASYIGKLQGDVTALVNVMFRGIEERVTPFELTVSEYSVFVICSINEPLTISDLGQHVPVGVTRISRIVSKLEDRELVQKVRSPQDRRVVILEMTDEGRALARALTESVGEHYANVTKRVSEHEMTDLLGFIDRMTANAESAKG